jgi:hypothetical protein
MDRGRNGFRTRQKILVNAGLVSAGLVNAGLVNAGSTVEMFYNFMMRGATMHAPRRNSALSGTGPRGTCLPTTSL